MIPVHLTFALTDEKIAYIKRIYKVKIKALIFREYINIIRRFLVPMRNELIRWVRKYEKLHYVLKCFYHINDVTFVQDFINRSFSVLGVTSNGNRHKGKILYRIERETGGFFGNFILVLGDMWYADSMGMYPVVVWGEKCPYYEKDGVSGIFNAWEYYFEQYEDYHIEDLDSAYRVSNMPKDVQRLVFGIEHCYKLTEKYILELGRIMKKYISLNCETEQYINQNINMILGGKKTLGVQIRMGGMLANCNEHPIVPTLGEYIKQIKLIYKKDYEQIFLATDDVRALKKMKKEFGNCLVYYFDVTRVAGKYSTYCVNTEQEKHYYRCGLEVLLDMYTLAKCTGLVAGLSQVSIAAQIAKVASGKKYEDLLIIDKGINHNHRKAPNGTKELFANKIRK